MISIPSSRSTSTRPLAEELAQKQREISVGEFFERNKHILGFDSAVRALITTVKEAVDNSLDACEEAGILPEISVEVRQSSPKEKPQDSTEYTVTVEDNGPGIVKKEIGNVFARLLYGSRFHSIRQTRGQQGIGISAVVMYGQLTTGKPALVETKIAEGYPVNAVTLALDTRKNRPEILKEEVKSWEKPHGTRLTVHVVGKYQRGPQSVFEYLRSTAIVNPHARIRLLEPDGTVTIFERATDHLPPKTSEIKPHPEGMELGLLLKMARSTKARRVVTFLREDFSRVSERLALEITQIASATLGVSPEEFRERSPPSLGVEEGKAILEAFRKVRFQAPPTDCLSPIGENLIRKGLRKEMKDVEFIATVTRPPSVYLGNPFVVEAGIAYGGSLPPDEPVRIVRFANRVPLLYQKGACVSTEVVESLDWRRYGLEQRGGRGLPVGPAVLLVHVASTHVPFTSESKEAIAPIPQIEREIVLALQECGRKLGAHLRKKRKKTQMKEKEALIRKLIPKIAEKSASILGRPVPDCEPVIARIMNNVMIDDEIVPTPATRTLDVRIRIVNYTREVRSFDLISKIPPDLPLRSSNPPPDERGEGFLSWSIRKLRLLEKRAITYELEGDPSDYEETELFVRGIDPDLVVGAEPFEGGKESEEPVERITVLERAQEADPLGEPPAQQSSILLRDERPTRSAPKKR